jgi:acyl-coenzyme A thioesterase PaaI-like protein
VVELEGDDYCFGCGQANAAGLRLQFRIDEKRRLAEATFTPRREHQGYAGIVHGGIIAALLDEAMLKLCWELGIPAVTARLDAKLKKTARVGEELRLRGWIDEDHGRVIRLRAEVTDATGAVVAAAKGVAVVKGPRR